MIVVDASAIVDALLAADETDELADRLAGEDLHAPHLLDFEVFAALRMRVIRGELDVDRGAAALADFDDLPIERWPSTGPLRERAYQLRDAVSGYDAAYVALAEALECPLVTRDVRLARSSGHEATIEAL